MGKVINRDNDVFNILLVPIMFIIGIVPLIVRLKVVPIVGDVGSVWVNDKFDADLFSWDKSFLIVMSAVILVILFLIKLSVKGRIRAPHMLIPLYAYSFFVVLSTIMSKHKDVAFKGFPSRYEGMEVLLAYVAVLFITVNIIENKKSLRIIIGTLIASSVVIGLIGVFQYFGLDLFKSELGRYIMLPTEYLSAGLNFQFGKNTIYSTLFNTNNVGSYAAMLFPLSLCIYLFVKDKYIKILAGLFSCLMFMLWIGCKSIFGFLGGTAAIVFLIVFFGGKVLKEYKYLLIILAAYALLFGIMNYTSNGAIVDNSKKLTGQSTAAGVGNSLKDIQAKNDEIYMVTSRNPLKIQYKSKKLNFMDKDGKYLEATETIGEDDKINYVIKDNLYSDYQISYESKSSSLQINICNRKILLLLTDKGIAFLTSKSIGHQGNIDKIDVKGKESYGSGRLLIWSRSIPILKNTILLGTGPDTFAFDYPQNDYVGKLLGLYDQNILVDKPHSMFLQMGINTGVLSLVCFLVFILLFYISTIKILWKRELDDIYKVTSVGILAAVIGYLVSGLGNDSIVSVAPVFWTLIGVGIAINYNLKNESDKKLT